MTKFSLIKAELNQNYKDRFLIELSNLNVVHLIQKKIYKIRDESKEKDPLMKKIRDLRKNLDSLFNRLDLTESDLL